MAEMNMMQWTRLLSSKRCSGKEASSDPRSEFQRDIDRFLFSDPFRRLARKTQVHPLNEDDHVHSRLTHSLEVASVGRSLGEAVGKFLKEEGELPDELWPYHVGQIVQAACLAHDIGNPPFGHGGEEAIKDWFQANRKNFENLPAVCLSDFTKFDGNAMAVRILLNTGFYSEGMDPTLPVLGALLKYPWDSAFDAKKDKFSYFQTEAQTVETVAEQLGLISFGDRFARHPLAYLTEAADDICYRIIDLEDATEVGIIDPAFMLRKFAGVLKLDKAAVARHEKEHFRQRNSSLRTKLIGKANEEILDTFKVYYDAIMDGSFDYASSLLDAAEGEVCKVMSDVYSSLEDTLFLSRRKAILELGAQNSISSLLQVILTEVEGYCTEETSPGEKKVKVLLGKELVENIPPKEPDCPYRVIMTALDYVTGMSDHYATKLCRKLLGLGF